MFIDPLLRVKTIRTWLMGWINDFFYAGIWKRAICKNVFDALFELYPARIYLFKVNNGNNRTICDICLKLTIKTSKRLQLRWSTLFHKICRPDVMVSLLITFNRFYTLSWYFYCWLWTSKYRLRSFNISIVSHLVIRSLRLIKSLM